MIHAIWVVVKWILYIGLGAVGLLGVLLAIAGALILLAYLQDHR